MRQFQFVERAVDRCHVVRTEVGRLDRFIQPFGLSLLGTPARAVLPQPVDGNSVRHAIQPCPYRPRLGQPSDLAEAAQPNFLQHVERLVLVAEQLGHVIHQRPFKLFDQIAKRGRFARLAA